MLVYTVLLQEKRGEEERGEGEEERGRREEGGTRLVCVLTESFPLYCCVRWT